MTKKNLIIVIILLSIIDLMAAAWYMSRRIEAGQSSDLFAQRDSSEVVVEADTVVTTFQEDLFDEVQHNTYYFKSNSPAISGDNSSYYTSIKHVKVRWPLKVNGNSELDELNKELITKAFGNTQSQMKDARYVFLNTPAFNKPIGDDYKKLSSAPTIVPVYGNVTQVLVYPYMTSNRLLVMEIDKIEYNGSTHSEDNVYVHYDRQLQRLLSRLDILPADRDKENKLVRVINDKIDDLNKNRADGNKLQHAINVPSEVCCSKDGIIFQYKQGSLASTPVEVKIGYDKLENFLTADFLQLVQNNDDYKLFNDGIKAEPINATVGQPSATRATSVTDKKSHYGKSKSSHYGKSKSSYRKSKSSYRKRGYVKPRYKSRRRYSGARHRSGYHSRAARRR